MKFQSTYCNETNKTKPENAGKIVLSNDAYAIMEMLEIISRKLTNG